MHRHSSNDDTSGDDYRHLDGLNYDMKRLDSRVDTISTVNQKPVANTSSKMLRYKKPKYDIKLDGNNKIKSKPIWFKPPSIR